MMFAPSVDGISHAENERIEWQDCVAAANVYLEVNENWPTPDHGTMASNTIFNHVCHYIYPIYARISSNTQMNANILTLK